jgi:hypothetical protein
MSMTETDPIPSQDPPPDEIDQRDGDEETGRDEIVATTHARWRQGRDHVADWLTEATVCFDFIAGHQWTIEDERRMRNDMRVPVTFNRTGPVISAVSGYEINGRQQTVYIRREPGDAKPNEIANAAGIWFRQEANAEDEESDMFRDALICGMGWVETRLDYDAEPLGKPAKDRISPREMAFDPAAVKPNLEDRRWHIRGRRFPLKAAQAKWPAATFAVDPMRGAPTGDLGTPGDREADRYYIGPSETPRDDMAMVFVLHHQWVEYESVWYVRDPASGQGATLSTEDWKRISEKAAENDIELPEATRLSKPKYFEAFVCGGELLSRQECQNKAGFTIGCVTGVRDETKNVWYGLVRAMLDPQRWANKWLSQTLHNLNTSVKGGVISEEGAFGDDINVEDMLAKPGWHLQVQRGSMDKMRFVTPQELSTVSTETWRLIEFAMTAIRDVTGVNVEMLGLADRDQPGILEAQRKKSAMVILAPLFNSLRRYRKKDGEIVLWYLQNVLSDGRLVRIVGEGKKQYIPLFREQLDGEYDVIIDEAPQNPNQQEAVFGALMQLAPMIMKAGGSIPPEFYDYIPGIPQELIEKLKEKANAPNPEAEARKMLEAGQAVADIDKTAAEAEKARALALQATMGMPVDIAAGLASMVAQIQRLAAMAQGGQPPPMPPQGPPMQGTLPPPDMGAMQGMPQ